MSNLRSCASVVALTLLLVPSGAAAASIDLSQLCGTGDCVVSTNTTIVSASRPLEVGGNFTVNPGVLLEFRVPIRVKVAGDMVVSGTVGAPGDGGDGGAGGDPSQPGGVGGNAPSVVGGVFDVNGSITLSAGAAAVVEGGSGGSGGMPGLGQTAGGAGGVGGLAGALAFNTCGSFTSASGARILASGGSGGLGPTGAVGGAGGAGGTVIITSQQTIVNNGVVVARGGAGGSGGAGSGATGLDGSITLRALGAITVGSGTLDSGGRTPSVNSAQLVISELGFCPTSAIPTLSEWTMLLLALLIVMVSLYRLRQSFGPRPNSRPGV